MLGWEFPPFISGGLGTACYGLTKAMSELGMEVVFVLPTPIPAEHASHVKLVTSLTGSGPGSGSEPFEHVEFRAVGSLLQPYQNPSIGLTAAQEGNPSVPELEQLPTTGEMTSIPAAEVQARPNPYQPTAGFVGGGSHYAGDLFDEVNRYAHLVAQIGRQEQFDVVHAHDWMTYPAAVATAAEAGKPLVVHVHSTEFDRSGEQINHRIYHIERHGMHKADKIIAVSCLTKNVCMYRYGVNSEKVEVVYNSMNGVSRDPDYRPTEKDEKIVLFLGRITMQKGPEYFLAAARKVLEKIKNVKFIMSGNGDMMRRIIEMAAEMGIGHKVLFTGFLRGPDVDRAFQKADLYVMPSVSEPFGITPLEAMARNVPVIISKQSGVAEVLRHVLKVDFWDVNELANKIIAVLMRPALQQALRKNGAIEVNKLDWTDSARQCANIYRTIAC